MPLNKDGQSVVRMLEKWFENHCDGTWEHHYGITIETSDNPGWILTFKELKITKKILADTIGDLLRDYDAQVGADGTTIRVFAPSLNKVLLAAAILIEKSENASGVK